jgi:hypothetical protein
MKLLHEASEAFADIEPGERVRLARLGSVLFMAGSLMAIPAALLLEPAPELYEHAISAVGFFYGVALYRLEWERLPSYWLHVFPVAGTLIVLAGVTVFSVVFSFFIVLAGMFVAVSVRSPGVFAAYIAFFVFILVLPLTYASGDLTQEAVVVLATVPVLLAVSIVSHYMHEVVARQKEQYRLFASEAIALGERIRGAVERVDDDSAAELEQRMKDLRLASSKERRDWPSRPTTWPPSPN